VISSHDDNDAHEGTDVNLEDGHDVKKSTKDAAKQKYKEEIEKLKNENHELKDKLLRSMAEFDNARKRAEKQLEENSKYAISNFAKSLLNGVDNLYRATENIPEQELESSNTLKNINIGIEMTKKEFAAIFEKFEVKRIFPEIGTNFDHNYHQAVAHIPVEGQKPGTIVNVLQAGYVLYERLLRPAMVTVSK